MRLGKVCSRDDISELLEGGLTLRDCWGGALWRLRADHHIPQGKGQGRHLSRRTLKRIHAYLD